jgi:pimeloyl-ACP methyl ester carboxylesterase
MTATTSAVVVPSAADAATRSVDVAGSPVRTHVLGDGPPVLLLHGSGPGTTGWGAWGPVAAALAGRHTVVTIDQAGFGGTPVLPGRERPGLDGWVAQAAGVMDALDLPRYAVVGHSMGGAVALALGAAQHDRVTRVVGVAAMGAPGLPLSPALDRLWATRPGEARALLELLFHDSALVTDAAIAAREEAMTAGAETFARLFPAPRERWVDDLTLAAGTLAAVTAPVLLVHGAQDRITPLREAALPLLDALPDARLHGLGRCGHVPAVEHPHAFLALLSDFLDADA